MTPAGLGTGYAVFFTYSALIGAFAVVLSLMVLRQQRRPDSSSSRTLNRRAGEQEAPVEEAPELVAFC